MRKLKRGKIVAVAGIILLLLMTYMGKMEICYGEKAVDISGLKVEEETLSKTEEENILPEELDLGDYTETMHVGERQLLSVTVLPESSTGGAVTYSSSDSAVAIINGMGRITAVSVGTTVITAKCGAVSEEFTLTVKEIAEETQETKISVTDIEVADYEDELEVDKTMTLSANVLPSDATDNVISYCSSNTNIATVSSAGELKGLAPGQVTITLTAGGYSKDIVLTVKLKTEAVQVNSTYVVLKKGESFLLKAKVVPEEADQSLSYKSADTSVASVSDTGEIYAESTGSTAIIVSGKDMSNAVTVIVNDIGSTESSEDISAADDKSGIPEEDGELLELLSGHDTIVIQPGDYKSISRTILKKLYEDKKTLVIEDDNYRLTLSGEDIVNYQNELCLPVQIEKAGNNLDVILNSNKNLAGKVTLCIKDADNYNYVYLYNEGKKKYEQIHVEKIGEMSIDTAGKYKLTQEKISGVPVSLAVAGMGSAAAAMMTVIYVAVKRKYWFW